MINLENGVMLLTSSGPVFGHVWLFGSKAADPRVQLRTEAQIERQAVGDSACQL